MADGTTQTLTDAWVWIKDDRYMMKVGVVKDDEWTEVYGDSTSGGSNQRPSKNASTSSCETDSMITE